MQIQHKQYRIKKNELSVKNIEALIIKSGLDPLRWSIVKAENNELIIDAVAILK